MEEMNENEEAVANFVNFSKKISLAAREQLERDLEEEIIDEKTLLSFLRSKESRISRRERKLQRKQAQKTDISNKEIKHLKVPEFISYEDSRKIWGSESIVDLARANISLANNAILKNPRFNFFSAFLNGLTIERIKAIYPDLLELPKSASKDLLHRTSSPGFYYISLANELVNLPPLLEKESWPDNFYRLDINLAVELLVSLLKLGRSIPNIFIKTSYGLSGSELCLKAEKGKIIFSPISRINGFPAGLCLVKDEAWMDNWA